MTSQSSNHENQHYSFAFPAKEKERLEALSRYRILDTPQEETFDRLTQLVTRLFKVPIALISLVDQERQWFKSYQGLQIRHTERIVAFCAYTILSPTSEVMVVPDALLDARFANNPFVTNEPHIRFYAGAPLRTHDGYNLGTLSIIDTQPRQLSAEEQTNLKDLAMLVMDQLELRLAVIQKNEVTAALRQSEARFRRIFDANMLGISFWQTDGVITEANQAFLDMIGYNRQDLAAGKLNWRNLTPATYAPSDEQALEEITRRGVCTPYYKEYVRKDGSQVPLLMGAIALEAANRPTEQVVSNESGVTFVLDLTEQKRVEAQLRQSEHQYQTLFETARRQAQELELLDQVRTALARELDLSVIFRVVVEAIASVFGYTQVSLYLVQAQLLILQHQVGYKQVIQQIPIIKGVMARVARSGQPLLLEDVRTDPEFLGAIEGITSEIAIPLFGEDSTGQQKIVAVLNVESVGGVVLGKTDLELMLKLREQVTIAIDRARLYSQVQASEKQFRNLIENMQVGITLHGKHSEILLCNQAGLDLFGLTQDQVLGKTSYDESWHVIHEDGSPFPGYTHPVVEAATTGKSVQNVVMGVYRLLTASYVWLLVNAEPQLDAKGKVSQIIVNFSDITQRKQAEEALRQAETRLQTVINNAPVILYSTNLERIVTLIRGKGLETLGVVPGRIVGRSVSSIFNPKYPEIVEIGQRVLTTSEAVSKEVKLGEAYLAIYEQPLRNEQGAIIGTTGVALDITGRKQAEEALKQAEEQLRQAQKMEAIGRLAGGVAHDFNNLLTGILGYCDLALFSIEDGEAVAVEDIQEIKKAADRAASLTRQLLAFSRKQILQPKVLNLNEVVSNSTSLIRRLIGENIKLTTRLEPELGNIKADPHQLEQVLINLAVNGRDALLDVGGGELSITTENIEMNEELVRSHPPMSPGFYVLLTVSDTGSGMDNETMRRIFEPFFTTKELGKGTGLGLATVYGIIKQSGGYIWVASKLGNGTVFSIYLPRLLEKPNNRLRQALSQPDLLSSTRPLLTQVKREKNVLVVEDEEALRRLIRRVLEQAGYNVLEAQNGKEALQLYQLQRETIELVITDIVMPELGGEELVQQLKKVAPELKVLYMSGYNDRTLLFNNEALAADLAFLEKPFTPEALTQRVRQMLNW